LAAVQELGPRAELMQLDLGSDDSIDAFTKELSAKTGDIDCLVNTTCVLKATILPLYASSSATIMLTAIHTHTLPPVQVNNAGTAYKAADPMRNAARHSRSTSTTH
jgi:NAD(P)-dependent dehydrogenase (short-subunit alcohol dehydrogenase family)